MLHKNITEIMCGLVLLILVVPILIFVDQYDKYILAIAVSLILFTILVIKHEFNKCV